MFSFFRKTDALIIKHYTGLQHWNILQTEMIYKEITLQMSYELSRKVERNLL